MELSNVKFLDGLRTSPTEPSVLMYSKYHSYSAKAVQFISEEAYIQNSDLAGLRAKESRRELLKRQPQQGAPKCVLLMDVLLHPG